MLDKDRIYCLLSHVFHEHARFNKWVIFADCTYEESRLRSLQIHSWRKDKKVSCCWGYHNCNDLIFLGLHFLVMTRISSDWWNRKCIPSWELRRHSCIGMVRLHYSFVWTHIGWWITQSVFRRWISDSSRVLRWYVRCDRFSGEVSSIYETPSNYKIFRSKKPPCIVIEATMQEQAEEEMKFDDLPVDEKKAIYKPEVSPCTSLMCRFIFSPKG